MTWRLENPDADDLGQGGVVLTKEEYEEFLGILATNGAAPEQTNLARAVGFVAPLTRSGMEALFHKYGMQEDIQVMAICREGRLDAMKKFIAFSMDEGSWPEIPN